MSKICTSEQAQMHLNELLADGMLQLRMRDWQCRHICTRLAYLLYSSLDWRVNTG